MQPSLQLPFWGKINLKVFHKFKECRGLISNQVCVLNVLESLCSPKLNLRVVLRHIRRQKINIFSVLDVVSPTQNGARSSLFSSDLKGRTQLEMGDGWVSANNSAPEEFKIDFVGKAKPRPVHCGPRSRVSPNARPSFGTTRPYLLTLRCRKCPRSCGAGFCGMVRFGTDNLRG